MKTTFLVLASALSAASVMAADAQAPHVRIHMRSMGGNIHVTHSKFYVTPMGKQCAYDPKYDPSLYPCQDNGVCVRTNATYGKCFTQAEAAKLNATRSKSDDDDEDDSEEDEEEGSAASALGGSRASNSTSGSKARSGPEVGDEDDDEDDEDDDDDDDEEDEPTTKPPAHKHKG